ncbi:AKAP7 2'5' RNA ligase-like domain-containing protein [Rhypophila decipiens]|uniref:AKAP7 2'5' RNA ligase-like domain-containing protein n=1 Tax=Rhypophila decipiens TaxID=261697 RepID=A0AAN7B8Z3_9PEZI|nr:AKAP7 2'5' RNA ligase-like domain-containing protein [Rhypophila decipiens]
MPPQPSLTHFLCIPLVTRSSRPQLTSSLASFREQVTSPLSGFNVPEEAIRPVGSLHLTLGMFSFPGDKTKTNNSNLSEDAASGQGEEESQDRLEKAKAILQSLRPREIIRAFKPPPAMPGSAATPPLVEQKEQEEIKITLQGLRSMQSTTPTKSAVLYAPPADPQGRLQQFCEGVRKVFLDAGVMVPDNRPLLLHATIVNTIYVKGRNRQQQQRGRGGHGQGRNNRRDRLTIDATSLLDQFEDQVWMEDVRVEKIAICKMGAKKIEVDGVAERRRAGGGGTPTAHHARPTAASAARSGSPSASRAMRVGSSTATAGRHASPGPGAGAGSVIAAPPRAALNGGGGGRSGTSSPAPDEYRNQRSDGTGSTTIKGKDSTPTSSANSSPSCSSTGTTTPLPDSNHHLQQKLVEKTNRISHLERELLIMESEFTRELDKLSRSESETSSFWQAKYSSLNQQYLRTDTELRLLRSEQQQQQQQQQTSSSEKSQNQERERQEQQQQQQQQQQEREAAAAAAALFRSRYESLARQLRERDDEIRTLQGQIRGLKEWVSTSTRSDGTAQTSDEVFGEGMARLGNSLQNWVLVNFRRAKIEISKSDGKTLDELGRLVPMYEDLASTSKIHLIQSLVSRILVEHVFDAYFVGLSSEQSQQFTQMETFLASFASSPEAINQWRSMTLGILKKEADQKMQNETAGIIESVISKVNTLLDTVTDIKSSEGRDQALRALVSSAIELSRLLVVQRAIFKVSMPELLPHQQTMFDPSTMEDIGGEDEESLEEREICCVTFPGIIKRGDESGGHLQYRNVISKARVLCSPE